MTDETTQALLPVTQADRDAAASINPQYFNTSTARAANMAETAAIKNGSLDHHENVQAFARHRLAHSRPSQADAGERSKIVAWLHSIDEGPMKGWQPNALAIAIERGDYFRVDSTGTDKNELGRFGHHPDPAIDFCHEVECCENEAYDLRGEIGVNMRGALLLRIERAMTFRVGGDQGCVAAKQRLRDLEAAMKEGREREYIDGVIAARRSSFATLTDPPTSDAGEVAQTDEELADWFIRRMDGWAGSREQIARMLARHRSPVSPPFDGAEACQRCGRDNPSWSAPSPLWNAVMRGGSVDGEPLFGDIVCAPCFITLAEQAGIATDWRLQARNVSVPLETVTPTGRIWDGDQFLWVNPEALSPPTSGERMRRAAQRVLDGLNARNQAAAKDGRPVAIFDGIAELAAALNEGAE